MDSAPVTSHRLIPAAVAGMILIWGTTWAAIRVGLQGMPPFFAAALRFAIAGGLLLGVALARRVPLGRTRRERWLWLFNGVLSFALSYGVVYWVEQWLPSGLTSVIFATFPLFVAGFAHLSLPQERLGLASSVGLVLGFVGVALIFSEDLALLGGPRTPRAALIMLVSPVAAAMGSVAVKRWGAGIHPLSMTSVPMLIGSAALGLVALLSEQERTIQWTGPAVGALLYLALAGSAVTFLLFFWSLQRVPATRLSLIAYVVPVLAMCVGILAMDEPLTPVVASGSAVVVVGVAVASRATRGASA